MIIPFSLCTLQMTYSIVNEEWESFNNIEPISCNNHYEHWVDDVNSQCHDLLYLEDVWLKNDYQITNSCTFDLLLDWIPWIAEHMDERVICHFWSYLAMDFLENEIELIILQAIKLLVKTRTRGNLIVCEFKSLHSTL